MCMKGCNVMSVEETIKNEKIPEEEMVKINGEQ